MDTTVQKAGLRKLFDHKYFTYVMSADSYHGAILEVEIKVVGKTVELVYKKVKERISQS